MDDSRIEFLSEPFEIADNEKIEVFRYNSNDNSPYSTRIPSIGTIKWDYSAKAVRTNSPFGIYGVTPDHLYSDTCDIFIDAFQYAFEHDEELTFLKLEVGIKDVLYISELEITFKQANLIKIVPFAEFTAAFPDFLVVFDRYKRYKESGHSYETRLALSDAISDFKQAMMIKRRWMNHKNDIFPHRVTHFIRVERNGLLLAKNTEANLTVVRLFAYYHDLCRISDGEDPGHGKRVEDHLRAIRDCKYLEKLSATEFEDLCFACRNHTHMVRSGNPTIDTCFDADRLDLARVGIMPSTELMATDVGAYYAKNPELFSILSRALF